MLIAGCICCCFFVVVVAVLVVRDTSTGVGIDLGERRDPIVHSNAERLRS